MDKAHFEGRQAQRVAVIKLGAFAKTVSALSRIGAEPAITLDRDDLLVSEAIVIPGNTAFATAMTVLRDAGLDNALAQSWARGIPILGIGVGMQVLFERSYENGVTEGLSMLRGEVVQLPSSHLHRVPNSGLRPVNWCADSCLAANLPDDCRFHHAHSFAVVPADDEIVMSRSVHREPFTSVVQSGSLFGVQFRPEVSKTDGLQVIHNFLTQGLRHN
jgi:imidazole glycerol-phosphate synthase subunit HisH